MLSAAHEAEFEAAFEEAVDPRDATVTLRPFLRVRLRDPDEEVLLLLALHGGLLDALRAALLERAQTFGPTCPRITVA